MSLSKSLVGLVALCAAATSFADQPIETVKRPGLYLVDSTGEEVGVLFHINGFDVKGGTVVLFGNNQLTWLIANSRGFVDQAYSEDPAPPGANPGEGAPQGVLFDMPGCNGNPYMRPLDQSDFSDPLIQPVHGAVGDRIVYAYDVSGYYDPSQQINLSAMQSTLLFDGTCEEGVVSPIGIDVVNFALPAILVTDLRRFLPPFRFEVK